MAAATPEQWGDWSLGDLADTARDVAGLIGRSEDVETLVIEKPEEYYAHVWVTVRDERASARMRNALKNCGYEAQFIGYPSRSEWTVEVAEIVISVQMDG